MTETTKQKLSNGMVAVICIIACLALVGLGLMAGKATSPSYAPARDGGTPSGSPPAKTYRVTEEELNDWSEVQKLRERQKMAGENYERFGGR